MTSRLYYTDSYLATFDARVAEVADGGRRVYLDRTAFYPTSGGQPFDMGTLAGVPVTDVVDEGERIAHLLAQPLSLAQGATIAGRVDWARRFDHMQQHTGQHLLSAVLHDRFGWQTLSVHFGADSSTLDVDVEQLPAAQLLEAETQANAIVFENRPVTVAFEDAGAASGLRKASERAGTLRVVTIAGLDRSACGGTHVRATGEIGPILVRKTERIRKATRLEFLCGMRAVRRARADWDALGRIAQSLSASVDEAAPLVEAQSLQLREAESARKRLLAEVAASRLRALADAVAPDAAGVRRLVLRDPPGGAEALRALGAAAATVPRVVLVGIVTAPPFVLLATSPDSGVEAGTLLKPLLDASRGRGGGSPRLAQGTVPDAPALERIVAELGGG